MRHIIHSDCIGDFFEIQPGYNTVEWEVASGEITAIKITPRWRYL